MFQTIKIKIQLMQMLIMNLNTFLATKFHNKDLFDIFENI